MSRSPSNSHHQLARQVSRDDYKAFDEVKMKPPSDKTSYPLSTNQNDKFDTSNRTVSRLVTNQPLNPSRSQTSYPLSTNQNNKFDNSDRTLSRLVTNQPLNPSRSQTSSNISLKSMVIEGKWKYREHDDDHLRLESKGVNNLVTICHDIMTKTLESPGRKQEKRKKSPSKHESWPIVKLDEFKKLTNNDRNALNRAKLFQLMTIVYEATSTNASISQLVRIWREATEHNLRLRRLKSSQNQPLISYEQAFQHLIRRPDNQLLQIALHASIINTHNQSDLQRLGKNLGIRRNQFNINSICDSTRDFQNLIKFLREQKLTQKREQQYINTNKLPYERKKKQDVYANVSGTKFRLICQAVDASGFYISPDSDFTCNLLWNDTLISMDIVSALKPYQKVNHFPTMNEISRKDLLAKNYDRLSNLIPKEYNFAPKTWILPKDYNLWYSYASNQPKKHLSTYIVKPTNTAMGQGIAIHCDYKQIQPMDNYIVQEYIREPYLMDGFKFDLRIYALITSCDPLRVFMFNNGLVRMSSKKYEIPTPKNALNLSMHLTNYLEDENNTENDFDTDNGKKQSLKFLFDYLKKQKQDIDKLYKEIQNIVIKTIFLAEPHLFTAYRKCRSGTLPISESVCFELLGFDILIDKNFKPWIIEVNRCPSFDMNEQIEFDIKIKLLIDTFHLLNFGASDRKKSIATEKIEAQRRLYANIGKHTNNQTNELDKVKENLYLLQREKAREIFENQHSGGFIRLFPTNDKNRMNELMNILTKCFQALYTNQNDLSWGMMYDNQYNEEELLDRIARLKDINQTDRHESSGLTYSSTSTLGSKRASSANSFTFETSDDEKRSSSRSPRSDKTKKSLSPTTDSFMKRASTQTPSDILRSTSSSPVNITKRHSNSLITTGRVSRSQTESRKTPPGVSASRITEKKAYSTLPSSSSSAAAVITDHQQSHSLKTKKSNDKSQMVTFSSIIQATQKQQLSDQSTPIDIIKQLQLTDNDLNRLQQLIFDEMNKLCIHYPNKSDEETDYICSEITENWSRYKSDIGRFWLVELDADKRESVIEIVWNIVQQTIKKICIIDELVQQLPLNRHLMKLRRRLLSNHGQCLWDACQNKNNSWESVFVKSTNYLTTIELDCCNRFVDLCEEALFIVYRYSIDEKIHKKKQIDRGLTVMVKS